MFTQILLQELFPNLLAQKWSNKNMNDNLNKDFECIKCENKEFVEGKINTTGSGLSKFFNIQLHTFQTISCSECGYTDLFRREKSSFLSRLLQFFTN